MLSSPRTDRSIVTGVKDPGVLKVNMVVRGNDPRFSDSALSRTFGAALGNDAGTKRAEKG